MFRLVRVFGADLPPHSCSSQVHSRSTYAYWKPVHDLLMSMQLLCHHQSPGILNSARRTFAGWTSLLSFHRWSRRRNVFLNWQRAFLLTKSLRRSWSPWLWRLDRFVTAPLGLSLKPGYRCYPKSPAIVFVGLWRTLIWFWILDFIHSSAHRYPVCGSICDGICQCACLTVILPSLTQPILSHSCDVPSSAASDTRLALPCGFCRERGGSLKNQANLHSHQR